VLEDQLNHAKHSGTKQLDQNIIDHIAKLYEMDSKGGTEKDYIFDWNNSAELIDCNFFNFEMERLKTISLV
jgi:hypothetical protein